MMRLACPLPVLGTVMLFLCSRINLLDQVGKVPIRAKPFYHVQKSGLVNRLEHLCKMSVSNATFGWVCGWNHCHVYFLPVLPVLGFLMGTKTVQSDCFEDCMFTVVREDHPRSIDCYCHIWSDFKFCTFRLAKYYTHQCHFHV